MHAWQSHSVRMSDKKANRSSSDVISPRHSENLQLRRDLNVEEMRHDETERRDTRFRR
jgi:hypothetical protein